MPTDTLRIAIAQLNPAVGDIEGNLDKARRARAQAARENADLVVFSELFIAGYPAEDLVLKPSFVAACGRAVEALVADTADGGPGIVIGTPWGGPDGVQNAVVVADGGRIEGVRAKVELPNYGVFDEKRIFRAGPLLGPVPFRSVRLGVPICEDIWIDEVVECLAETGAELLVVPNGSPYWRGKADQRLQVAVARVVESGLPLIYQNQVGGQDELVFDGASFGLNADRTLAFQMPAFIEQVSVTKWQRGMDSPFVCTEGPKVPLPDLDEANWTACVIGLRDYVDKNGAPGVVLGLSGGIDSAVCAVMAVDALGPDRVHCVMLPYRYTSSESLADAAELAATLAVRYDSLPIAPAVEGLENTLAPLLEGRPRDTTEENLQSRARGALLMAISNKLGPMLVTTGNKSEISVGYATLYGDMNGAFNPIKDLYKTEVLRLARWRNTHRPDGLLGPQGRVIPKRTIEKPPSAELRENQRDEDSLPPYQVLDAVLERLVEEDRSVAEIVAEGFDPQTVRRIESLLYGAEFKRRQAAPGVKITRRNFGRDRRYPITNRYRETAGEAS